MTVETLSPLGPHTKISTSQVHVHMLSEYKLSLPNTPSRSAELEKNNIHIKHLHKHTSHDLVKVMSIMMLKTITMFGLSHKNQTL